MKQGDNVNFIKSNFIREFTKFDYPIRFIKIHGGNFQECGLPDLMILIRNKKTNKSAQLWFEIKRDWNDNPSALQEINIKGLREFGFITGYFAGEEFKSDWNSEKAYSIEYIINKIYTKLK